MASTVPSKKRKHNTADLAAAAVAAAAESKPMRPPTRYFPITDDSDAEQTQPAVKAPQPYEIDADGEGEDPPESIDSLLEPLSREHLITLLRKAAASNPSTLQSIRSMAEVDPASRKLFVHGLIWTATAEDLRATFSRYGPLEEARVITDRITGRSKGYGFVQFQHRQSARRALRSPCNIVGGRATHCQLAANNQQPGAQNSTIVAANEQHSSSFSDSNVLRKVFVGNVYGDVDVDKLRDYFAQFGEIEEGPLGFDKVTGKPKGYALFVYKTVEGARRALEESVRNFDGKLLNVRKATDGRPKNSCIGATSETAVTASTITTSTVGSTPSPAVNAGLFDTSGYAAGVMTQDIGLAAAAAAAAQQQQAALLGQGMAGVGGQPAAAAFAQGMQQPNAAMFAMMAALMQNPMALSMNPAMLASFNPAFAAAAAAAAMGAAGGQSAVSGAQPGAAALPGYGAQGFFAAGNAAGYQNPASGILGAPGFPPPGFQGASGYQQGGAGSGVGYPGTTSQKGSTG